MTSGFKGIHFCIKSTEYLLSFWSFDHSVLGDRFFSLDTSYVQFKAAILIFAICVRDICRINTFLSHVNIGGCVIQGVLEAYSCKFSIRIPVFTCTATLE